MNRRSMIISVGVLALGLFGLGAYLYVPSLEQAASVVASNETVLERSHSPTIGPDNAPVTIVEFFDPACEACRAFHPYVKNILASAQGKVRLVLRYANFHPQSEEAIRILEAARLQGKFEEVLERVLAAQPQWAPHGQAGVSVWSVLEGTGLDINRAKEDALSADITKVLEKDTADVKAAGVEKTPTFFVNEKPLLEFGPKQLFELVKSEFDAS